MLLGSPDAAKRPAVDEEELVERPFSVELGEAVARGEGFLVGGLETRNAETLAFVAKLEAGGRGEKLELGRVFGDVEPPRVESHDKGALVLVTDNDASSVVLKLHDVPNPFDLKSVRRGQEIVGVRRDAPGFALGVADSNALIVWTKLEKGKGRLGLARVDLGSLTLSEGPRTLPVGDGEPESPRLVRRPGGYFLAWIARAPAQKPGPGQSQIGDAGRSLGILEEGPSAIELVPLDASGREVMSIRRVTPPSAHVTAFDMVLAPGGAALLVYRDDRNAPGVDGPAVEAVLVRPDGSTASNTWELGESVGLPSVLADSAPRPKGPWAWVFVEGERDARVGALTGDPLLLGELVRDERLAGVELLAASKGRILQTRSRGTTRELGLLACDRAAAEKK